MLLRISSSATFSAKMTASANWCRAAKSSTISATREISDRSLSIRISQDADNPACGGTEDPVFIAATRPWATIRRTIAACARCAIAGRRFAAGQRIAEEADTELVRLREARRDRERHVFPRPLRGRAPRLPTPRPRVYRGLPAPSTRRPLACTATCILTCIPEFNPLPRLSPRIPRLRRRRALSLGRHPAACTHRVAGAPEHPALDGPGH